LFLMLRARLAYVRVLKLSAKLKSAGETHLRRRGGAVRRQQGERRWGAGNMKGLRKSSLHASNLHTNLLCMHQCGGARAKPLTRS
jgi:hypothetical protein